MPGHDAAAVPAQRAVRAPCPGDGVGAALHSAYRPPEDAMQRELDALLARLS